MRTRGHEFKIHKPKIKNLEFGNISVRSVHIWNDLPSSIVNSNTGSMFKSKLKLIKLDQYYKRTL